MQYGLIGRRLEHSYSPQIQKQLRGYAYQLCPLEPTALAEFLQRRDFAGINVTIPYKTAVIPFCDVLSETARSLGAVNTIVRRPDGTLLGENTDIVGFRHLLRGAGVSLAGRRVLVLGSGGASQTVQAAAREAGAARVTVVSRTGNVNYLNVYERCADAQIVVNATPLGMFPRNEGIPLDLSRFRALEFVADLIYNPLRTGLLQQAKRCGVRHCNGLSMLVAQAAAAAECFTGAPQPAGDVESVTQNMQDSLQNWVLIGMPGCGKSTVGRWLAQRAEREFADVDALLEERAGLPCGEIIERWGEEKFRALECEVIAALGRRTGLVISTGGGAVVRQENVQNLQYNGKLLWIQREIVHLATAGRPLSRELGLLLEQRQALYLAAADVTMFHDEDWGAVQERAWEVFHS